MKKILIILFLIINSFAAAKTYYVATTGSDSNPGTLAQPWLTWSHAFTSSSVVGHDTVYFRGGTYNITSPISITRSGTAGNYICYFAYQDEIPILDGSGYSASFNMMIHANVISYVHMKGLTIRNAITTANGAMGIRGESLNHFKLENMHIYNIDGAGIYYSFSVYTETINCDFHDCFDEHSTHPGNWGIGVCFDGDHTYTTGYDYVYGCRAWNCSDQGFSCGNNYSLSVFDNCWGYDNGSTSIGSEGEANGFKFGMPQYQSTAALNVNVHNCIAAQNKGSGFDLNDGPYVLKTRVDNNFSYHNGGGGIPGSNGYGFLDFNATCSVSDRVFRNNIAYLNHVDNFYIYGGNYTSEYNSWDGGAPIVDASDFLSLDYSQLKAPRKSDGSLPDITFGKLTTGSDLIDAGTSSTGLPYNGLKPDLGWFESSSGTVIPAYVSSVIENATPYTLEMTYNLSLANIVPAASAFSVTVNASARSVSSVSISGTKVLLTLSSPVVAGNLVTVAYTKPASNPLQTAAGGQAASISAQNVTNNVAAVIPAFVSSVIENATPSTLEMTYNLSLANIVPAASAFSVTVNASARSVSSVSISGTKVLLTLSSPVVAGNLVTVAYTKPASNPLQTAAGGQAASISAQNVTNNVAAVIPAFVSSVIENATPSTLEMTYNLSLANIVPAASAFSVTVNASARSVSSVSISGTKVLLTLSSPVVAGNLVTVAYTKPASNPLQTAAGGQAASISAQNVTNNVAAVIPAFVSSVIENATPSTLEMTYNLSLANIVPAASAFSVTVNASARSVSSVSISGTKVLLTLSSPVVAGNLVTVAYTKPASNPLQTAAGGQAASISAQNVTNNVAAVIPAFVSSVIENATPSTLEMTYNLSLANIVPAASAFSVTVNASARSVSSVSISGTKVLLTLSSPVVAGNLVTVAYTKPASNPLQTAAGGQAASISAQNVTNNVAAVIPAFVSSVIENATPSTLEMTYNLSLANIVPAASAFSVTVNASARSVSSVSISGTKVLLTLSSPVVAGNLVTVAYTKPASNPLQTAAGGQAASISAQNVTNNVAAVIPAFVSSVIENATPSTLEMTYNLSLANIVPAASAFSVTVNASARSVSSVSISGTKVLLTLSSPVVAGNLVTVAYTKPASNPLQTAAGGQAASISAQNVTNNVAAVIPAFVSSVIENATPSTLEMTYNLSLANIVPAASAFSVTVNASARSVSSVSISGTKVLLTLSSPVVAGNLVTVAYTKPASNPLQTAAGGQAASISAQSVINNCNQPPDVDISSPTKSTSFIAPATITIEADARDYDGEISKVEFYSGTSKLGERTVSPYSFTWKEVAEGTYSLTAVATDNKNSRTTSAAVSVVVEKSATVINQLPVVTITSPDKTKNHKKNSTIIIEAVASDPDGSISKVEFKNGNITLAEVTTAPYIYLWEAVDTGTYMISVLATDNLGATSASANIDLIIDLFYNLNSEIINLYPNPNDGHFTIDVVSGFPEKSNKISIINLAGKTIYNETLGKEEYTKEIDISNMASGSYIFMVTNDQKIVATKKFIKN